MKKTNPLKLPIGYLRGRKSDGMLRKKTTHCTPAEILGRIEEVVKLPNLMDAKKYVLIEEILLEWQHS